VETAAWDAFAKASEAPLVELLGGEPRAIPAYASLRSMRPAAAAAEALRRVRALDEEGLAWIEEPTLAEDYAGHATIAAAARTPIQLGESWWGPGDMEKSIAAGASDHVTLDAMRLEPAHPAACARG
jgi:mandelate racemase